MPLLFTTHEAGMDKRVSALFPQDPAPRGGMWYNWAYQAGE